MANKPEANNSISPSVGFRIQTARSDKAWSRERLAEESDISVRFLADVENGKKDISSQKLMRICQALQVSTDYILFGTGGMSEQAQALFSRMDKQQQKLAIKILADIADSGN